MSERSGGGGLRKTRIRAYTKLNYSNIILNSFSNLLRSAQNCSSVTGHCEEALHPLQHGSVSEGGCVWVEEVSRERRAYEPLLVMLTLANKYPYQNPITASTSLSTFTTTRSSPRTCLSRPLELFSASSLHLCWSRLRSSSC